MVIAAAKKSSDTATIVVHTPISSLAFPYELTTLSLGNGSQLTFIAYDKAGKMVQFSPGSARWTSLSQGIVSVTSTGFARGQQCGFSGGFIPFAAERAERIASGDERLSLAERYGSHAAYVERVRRSERQLVRERLLLQEDADRIVADAARSDAFASTTPAATGQR